MTTAEKWKNFEKSVRWKDNISLRSSVLKTVCVKSVMPIHGSGPLPGTKRRRRSEKKAEISRYMYMAFLSLPPPFDPSLVDFQVLGQSFVHVYGVSRPEQHG